MYLMYQRPCWSPTSGFSPSLCVYKTATFSCINGDCILSSSPPAPWPCCLHSTSAHLSLAPSRGHRTSPLHLQLTYFTFTLSKNPGSTLCAADCETVAEGLSKQMCFSKPGLSYTQAKQGTSHLSLFNFIMLALAPSPILYKSF